MTTPEYAIIVAGGKGVRFGQSLPKQFTDLKGKPILIHTLEKFLSYSGELRIVLVLPESDMSRWEELVARYPSVSGVTLCTGGATRFESVKNGLRHVGQEGFVAVHDGVRPLVKPAMIGEAFAAARIHGCAVPAIPLKESLREVKHGETFATDRSRFRLVQTPQVFRAAILHQAYAQATDTDATDDATVAEKAGYKIHLIEGRYDNIKITTPEDLRLAGSLLEQ